MARVGRSAIRVLLSEGSSLSARETISALGPLGYRLEICDPNPICLGRFSRFVRAFHRCPAAGRDPLGYRRFVLDLLRRGEHDVLLPVHEQAFLFARFRGTLPRAVGVALASFDAFTRLQSKAAFSALLTELGLPQPRTRIVHTRAELEAGLTFPCYVKAPYGTAGRATWRVESAAALERVEATLEREGLLDGRDGLVRQEVAPGANCQAQAVFERGRLVAAHCTRQRAEGLGGSQSARVGVDHPEVRADLARLGQHLEWHGPLALDYLYDGAAGGPAYIEANPRLVEPMNAVASGLNLAEMVVRLSLGESYASQPSRVGRAGVQTHSLMPTLLGVAEREGSRLAVLREVAAAGLGRGVYAASREAVTPLRQDPPSSIPLVVTVARLLVAPSAGAGIAGEAIGNYALTAEAVETILAAPEA